MFQIQCFQQTSIQTKVTIIKEIYTKISQGSVATLLRCGGIFNTDFIANLLVSPPVKGF